MFCKIDILPLSSCLLFELCSLLLGRCRCLLEQSRPELHFPPKHLQLSQCEEAQVGLTIRENIVSRQFGHIIIILRSSNNNEIIIVILIRLVCCRVYQVKAKTLIPSKAFFEDKKLSYSIRVRSIHVPTICMSIMAVSTWFSTCTVISYFPEWLRSALRMKMMLSQSVLRMLTCVGSMALPSFSQVTFGLGLPCSHHTGFINLLRDTFDNID